MSLQKTKFSEDSFQEKTTYKDFLTKSKENESMANTFVRNFGDFAELAFGNANTSTLLEKKHINNFNEIKSTVFEITSSVQTKMNKNTNFNNIYNKVVSKLSYYNGFSGSVENGGNTLIFTIDKIKIIILKGQDGTISIKNKAESDTNFNYGKNNILEFSDILKESMTSENNISSSLDYENNLDMK